MTHHTRCDLVSAHCYNTVCIVFAVISLQEFHKWTLKLICCFSPSERVVLASDLVVVPGCFLSECSLTCNGVTWVEQFNLFLKHQEQVKSVGTLIDTPTLGSCIEPGKMPRNKFQKRVCCNQVLWCILVPPISMDQKKQSNGVVEKVLIINKTFCWCVTCLLYVDHSVHLLWFLDEGFWI